MAQCTDAGDKEIRTQEALRRESRAARREFVWLVILGTLAWAAVSAALFIATGGFGLA